MWGHAATRFFEVGVCSRTHQNNYRHIKNQEVTKNFRKIKNKFGNVISSS